MAGYTPLRTSRQACIVFVLVLAVLGSSGVATVTAQEETETLPAACDPPTPTSADDYLATFRAMQECPGLNTYDSLEIMRSRAVVQTQVGEFSESDRQRMQNVLHTLSNASKAAVFRSTGEFNRSLTAAKRSSRHADRLEELGGNSYRTLAVLALDTFYERIGEELYDQSQTQSATRQRVQTLEMANEAFKRASATDQYARTTVELDRLRKQFERDRDQLNRSAENASTFVSSCSYCGSVGSAAVGLSLGTFGRYQEARRAMTEADRALTIANRHEMPTEEYQSLRSEVGHYRQKLGVASAVLLMTYVIVVALVALLVTKQLLAWRRNLRQSRLGNVVLIGEMLDA